jgi:hypothetical protein
MGFDYEVQDLHVQMMGEVLAILISFMFFAICSKGS